MVDPIVSDERLISLPGRGVGAASEEVVRAAETRGYTVGATGPATFRLVKTYRPTWAIVAAVIFAPLLGLGLFFLLVRRSETGVISVFEDRDGTKARIVGDVDPEIVHHLSQIPQGKLKTSAVADPPAISGLPMPRPVGQPVAGIPAPASAVSPQVSPVPTNSQTPSPPLPQSPSTPNVVPTAHERPVAQTPGPSPFAVESIVGSSTSSGGEIDPDLLKTVSRPRRWSVDQADVSVVMPGGNELRIGEGIVVGRSPSVSDDRSSMSAVACSDPSLSKTHLSITPSEGGVLVTDMHSTNGTSIRVGTTTTACSPGAAIAVPNGAEIVAGDAVIKVQGAK